LAIEWGAWENHIRVGIDVSWEAITHGEAAATATIKIYTDVDQTWDDDQSLNFGGSISGSVSFHNSQTSGGGSSLRATKTYTYNYGANEYGSSPGSRTFSATLAGAYNGATPSKSVTSSIPKRPYDTPAAPTGVSVSRISDTSTKISWTNKDTAGEPWDLVRVQYDVAANDVWNGDIGTPSGSSTSFTWNSSVADNAYKFRVRAENSIGDSAYVETGVIYTTPNPPTSPTRSGTTTQSLTWAIGADANMVVQTEIWRSVNGVYSLLATAGSGVTSYTDSTASINDKVKYKFRHKTAGGVQGTLYSAYSAETTETSGVTSPPNAPTSLSPTNATIINPNQAKTFSWVHNPTDSSAQTGFQIQWRVVGSPTWTVRGKVTSATQSYSMPAATFPDNSDIEWQVRTWGVATTGGSDGTGASAFSASATLKTVGDPNAARSSKRALWLDLETGGMVTAPLGSLAPIGAINMFGGGAAPPGWLFCRGQAVSRTTYQDLFGVIGTAFGAGDGSTTFNLPDMRLRFPLGANDGSDAGVTIYNLGETDSARDTLSERLNGLGHFHTHGHTIATNTTGSAHGHNITGQAAGTPRTAGTASGSVANQADYSGHAHGGGTNGNSPDSSHSHGVTGGVSSATGLQDTQHASHPYVGVNFIIKV
jgi:microcystin-dependent protein